VAGSGVIVTHPLDDRGDRLGGLAVEHRELDVLFLVEMDADQGV
jgi:hypothetical protein